MVLGPNFLFLLHHLGFESRYNSGAFLNPPIAGDPHCSEDQNSTRQESVEGFLFKTTGKRGAILNLGIHDKVIRISKNRGQFLWRPGFGNGLNQRIPFPTHAGGIRQTNLIADAC